LSKKISADTTLGHYRIVSKLGAGGMGEVYLAQDTKLDRRVALKILPAEFAEDKDRMARFVREAKSASALNHPNIITIHEIGETDGTHFIATEFIDGETLNEYAKSNSLSLKSILDIAIQVASALDDAHSAGIVHRDIKPDNVMVRANGLVKILDFGIAKLAGANSPLSPDAEAATAIKSGTTPGMIIGTANYMSPEQAKGKDVDARTDIFSFGVVLYELISGHLPFEGENALEMIGAILKDEPKPLASDVPTGIQKIIGKCLRKDRDERYQTIRDVCNDLKDVKQELEFQNKLEATVSPDKGKLKTQLLPGTTDDEVKQTTTNQTAQIHPAKKYLAIGLAVLLISAIGFGYRYLSPTKQIESIAVLPFENASGNADLDYLSDGVAESVIDRLSQLPQLKVIARSSSFQYRGQSLNLKQIADVLGVDAIVTGKVVPRGDSYQIRVDLVDVRENKQLWGETFTRKISDVQILQTDISREIAENLRLRLSGAQQHELAKQRTTNPQAYELLLKGLFFRRKGDTESLKKAVEYYQQAIVLDPAYALAYAELSEGYRFLLLSSDLRPKEILPKWEAAARKALELDENLADAHFAMAQLRRDVWAWQEAERGYKRAIELNPNLARAHAGYSGLLSLLRRHDEAIAEVKRSRELDPLSPFINSSHARVFYRARRYEEAIEALKKAIELAPDFPTAHLELGRAYAAKGMYREAVAEYQQANKLGDKGYNLQIYLGEAYAKMGERQRAQAILKQLQTSDSYASPGQMAIIYAALDEREQALGSLEKAHVERDPLLQWLGADPSYDDLRSDPRFQDLLRRMNLPQ
jgi:serine/threonine-protein kinase